MPRDVMAVGLTALLVLLPTALHAVSLEQPATTAPNRRGSPEVVQPGHEPPTTSPTSPADESSEPSQTFTLPRWTIDGGGGASAGGAFTLTGTVGQPEGEGLAADGLVLDGGFWPGGSGKTPGPLFSDGFETGDASRWSAVSAATAPGSPSPGHEGGA